MYLYADAFCVESYFDWQTFLIKNWIQCKLWESNSFNWVNMCTDHIAFFLSDTKIGRCDYNQTTTIQLLDFFVIYNCSWIHWTLCFTLKNWRIGQAKLPAFLPVSVVLFLVFCYCCSSVRFNSESFTLPADSQVYGPDYFSEFPTVN